MPVVAVFGSSASQAGSYEYDTAELLGKLLARKGYGLATGGYSGIMEAALKGASSAGKENQRIGVTTILYGNKSINNFVNEEIKAGTYMERLGKLIELADAYVVLPGGTGSILEFTAVWALKARGEISAKPIVCIGEQWQEVVQTLGFYSEAVLESSGLLQFAESAEEAVGYLSDLEIL